MGMTDRQFDAYIKNILHLLEITKDEIKTSGSTKTLDQLMKNIEEQLKRP